MSSFVRRINITYEEAGSPISGVTLAYQNSYYWPFGIVWTAALSLALIALATHKVASRLDKPNDEDFEKTFSDSRPILTWVILSLYATATIFSGQLAVTNMTCYSTIFVVSVCMATIPKLMLSFVKSGLRIMGFTHISCGFTWFINSSEYDAFDQEEYAMYQRAQIRKLEENNFFYRKCEGKYSFKECDWFYGVVTIALVTFWATQSLETTLSNATAVSMAVRLVRVVYEPTFEINSNFAWQLLSTFLDSVISVGSVSLSTFPTRMFNSYVEETLPLRGWINVTTEHTAIQFPGALLPLCLRYSLQVFYDQSQESHLQGFTKPHVFTALVVYVAQTAVTWPQVHPFNSGWATIAVPATAAAVMILAFSTEWWVLRKESKEGIHLVDEEEDCCGLEKESI